MPAVRAYMVLASLAGIGETLACVPTPEAVEGFGPRGRRLDGQRPHRLRALGSGGLGPGG